MKSRRMFLTAMLAAVLPTGFRALASGGQVSSKRQPPPPPKDDDSNMGKLDPKLILETNQKEMRKNVQRLYDLASELKAEVEKTDSVLVFSLSMVKKTEEIERLAKEIRNRAKG